MFGKILRHKNIVTTIGLVKNENTLGIALEYCDYFSVSRYFQENTESFEFKIHLFSQIGEAIMYINSKNICHLDIKPQNILLDQFKCPKICDFGLCKFQDETQNNILGFTLNYSAPEQVLLDSPDVTADV